jgi:hypothetical protein
MVAFVQQDLGRLYSEPPGVISDCGVARNFIRNCFDCSLCDYERYRNAFLAPVLILRAIITCRSFIKTLMEQSDDYKH